MTTRFPDPEKAIIAALRHYLPDLASSIYTAAPNDWYSHDLLVVRATAGGASTNVRHWSVIYFEVEAFSNTRSGASLLARRASQALADAAYDRWRYEPPAPEPGGYLFRFREVNSPAIVYDGLSSKHGNTFMFQGTYQMSVRPLR